MADLLMFQRPRRRLPRDTTLIPPTNGPPSARSGRARNTCLIVLLAGSATRKKTLPREAPTGLFVTARPSIVRLAREPRPPRRRSNPFGRFVPGASQTRVISQRRRGVDRMRTWLSQWSQRGISRANHGIIVHVGDLAAALPITIGSGPPFMGGFVIQSIEWMSSHAIGVSLQTTYSANYLYQLYAGRTLIGATRHPNERLLVGQLIPSTWPQCLTILAVDPGDSDIDYGDALPLRPFNRVRLAWESSGMPTDTRYIEITAGTAAGGAVDPSNVLILVPFDVNRRYEWMTLPLEGSGTWNFEIAHRDDKPPAGNRGTAVAVAATITAIPPDLMTDSSGARFTMSVASGTATATFSY